ncbi:MAG: multifunctional CCA tRNA nucleotidyl transferase/2'3'-cyclic phosphodiesterase/2'nucleotidase/phosphatase [Coxiellaceae bacterium]|nr:multifunctional CCA tRNA nucleotidyl transferase/2'3'-cyclic phosphodiesterase/2'nucleotidase/phosphatase [Coxiellaceae bacterium]
MNIYLVGGAVRDSLLGRPVNERDWVVVGSNVDDMVARGFKPVGKDFPVFLHPDSKEEYALARTEKKVALGYKGFEFYANPDVTLEQDLMRRDLTINAIAQDKDGTLIDPYHGQQDIDQRVLRHVSTAFSEDPVRILRLARFHARFPDFTIADETIVLMKTMVNNGEVDALVPERVWAECYKALQETEPLRFFQLLDKINALEKVMPGLQLTTQNSQALIKACILSQNPAVRFASFCHTLNEDHSKNLINRIKLPKPFSELMLLTVRQLACYQQDSLTAEQVFALLKSCDAIRRPERFFEFIDVARACSDSMDHRNTLTAALHAVQQVNIQPLLDKGLQGRELAYAIDQLRLAALQT